MSEEIRRAQDRFGYVCNNSVCGGDCWGETRCGIWRTNPKLSRYEAATQECNDHEDYSCEDCALDICGCCYQKCPLCDYDPIYAEIEKDLYFCDWCGLGFSEVCETCINCDTVLCKACSSLRLPNEPIISDGKVICLDCRLLAQE